MRIILSLLMFFSTNVLAVKVNPRYNNTKGDWARRILASLTLREKIGQLFMAPTASSFEQPEEALASLMMKCPYNMDPDYIKKLITEYKVGGLIFLFKSSPSKHIDALNEYQSLSDVPLMIGLDAEWGPSMRLYETLRFPFNMTLGALENKRQIYELGREIGRQCKLLGIHINFSPAVDANNNPDNPVIHFRSFGEDPIKVGDAGLLMMQGLQDEGVMACAKHFPGHGDTGTDSHFELPVILHTLERLKQIELPPFKKLIDAGVCAVMNAHLAIPVLEKEANRASSLSRAITTELLEKELQFTGLKITDGLGMEALMRHFTPGQIELEAFLAGNEILLCPLDVPAAVELIEQAIKDGKVSMADLDSRVLKILTAKEWAGCHKRTVIDKKKAEAELITPSGKKLKERLYQEAITLITPTPFTPVAANKANKVAVVQIGGAQLNAFKNQLQNAVPCAYYYESAQSDEAAIHNIMTQLEGIETVLVPIFEMNKFSKQNYGLSATTLELLRLLGQRGKRVIVIPFGTPYSVTFFDQASAVVLAYEDDVEAQKAAADVVVGARVATGKSPVTWHKKVAAAPAA